MLDSSHTINDLRTPPGNRLERLKGDMRDYHSIRVNSQYRIVFRWTEKGADDVDFIDYH
ncbi:plasmid maintenance system killer protein [Corynebacterium bovis]|uniref:type II toxin-antitoxin system RelE/ParE family toxin n=1 Tax=Corynebacterium bovis TaxID=36808 RepID=UPI000F655908|nr:type II toxin-antitoxin system RelE/ParE family toxin [Corynebacterium bovis]RRO97071.1 plasmid maintenance system killer protein [Corynebacterium bovis]